MDALGLTRRQFLAAIGGGLFGATACTDEDAPVTMMVAGSLNQAFEQGLVPTFEDEIVQVEAHGSVVVARLVAEGKRDPDIVSLADAALFDGPLRPDGYVSFATNALVLAYDPQTPVGRRLTEVGNESWYRPLLDADVRLGRTDPDLDPLGYRTLFALELAERYHDEPALRTQVLRPEQVYPETALISQFEVGGIDAAFAYRSMAVARDYAYVELPVEINLSDPAYEEGWYATVSYRLPTGNTVRGGPISYVSTIRHVRPTALTVFRRQCRGSFLQAFGFSVPDSYPRAHGNVPDRVSAVL